MVILSGRGMDSLVVSSRQLIYNKIYYLSDIVQFGDRHFLDTPLGKPSVCGSAMGDDCGGGSGTSDGCSINRFPMQVSML